MGTLLSRIKQTAKTCQLIKIHYLALRSGRPLANLVRLGTNRELARVCTRTLVSYDRLRNVRALAGRCVELGIEGAFVECGVWRGGVAALMALVAHRERKGRVTHLFDSFQGLPSPTREDGEPGLPYATRELSGPLEPVDLYVASAADVRQFLFDRLRLDAGLVRLHEGWFQHTLPEAAATIPKIALLRIDADWYDSVRVCLEHLYNAVVPGGFVILDDYGGYPGCRLASDEFREKRGIEAELVAIDEYGVWFQKRDACAPAVGFQDRVVR